MAIYLIFIISTLLLMTESAGFSTSETKSMVFNTHRSISSGCFLVKKQIKKEAIENICGTDFQASSIRFKSELKDSLSKIYLETLSGYVVGFNNIQTTIDASQGLNKFECTVSVDIDVICNSGQRDPMHQPISASLNKTIYVDGDSFIINIDKVPHDRFISIVQIITRINGTEEVWVVVPNHHNNAQFIPANQSTTFPSNYYLITKLIDGEQDSDETLIIISTTHPQPVLKNKTSLEGFYLWLSKINLNNRRELFLPYRVITKDRTNNKIHTIINGEIL